MKWEVFDRTCLEGAEVFSYSVPQLCICPKGGCSCSYLTACERREHAMSVDLGQLLES